MSAPDTLDRSTSSMIDQIVLDRARIVRELIAEYTAEITRERSRLEGLRTEWARTKLAAEELAAEGREPDARAQHLAAHELEHRIDAVEEQIDRMEQLLGVFRRKLHEVAAHH